MGLIKNIALAAPLGIIYNLFMHKLVSIMLSEASGTNDDKHQKKIIILFIIGLVGLLIAFTIFTNSEQYKNQTMKYGLIFGNGLLLIYSMITNWDKMYDDTKLILMGIVFGGMVWYCYSGEDVPKPKKKKKNTEKIDKKSD